MTTYYHAISGARIANASRVDQSGSDDAPVIDWPKANHFILACHFYNEISGKNPSSSNITVEWRNKTQSGSWTQLSGTGELTWTATTDLVNDTALLPASWICSVYDAGYTNTDGIEREGANLYALDLGPNDESEVQWAINGSGGGDGDEYEFRIYDALRTAYMTVVPTITMEVPSSSSSLSSSSESSLSSSSESSFSSSSESSLSSSSESSLSSSSESSLSSSSESSLSSSSAESKSSTSSYSSLESSLSSSSEESASSSSSAEKGEICWGHDTDVLEINVKDFQGRWTGTGTIEGSGDNEVIRLKPGQYMESESWYIQRDFYQSGSGSVTIEYRTGATRAVCDAAGWTAYSEPFSSSNWVGVRLEA
jgi:hypothetical protein